MTMMNKLQFGVLSGLLAANIVVQLLPKSSARGDWEYKIESPSDEQFAEQSNKNGADGWDLVFARRAIGEGKGASYEMIYKRPK